MKMEEQRRWYFELHTVSEPNRVTLVSGNAHTDTVAQIIGVSIAEWAEKYPHFHTAELRLILTRLV